MNAKLQGYLALIAMAQALGEGFLTLVDDIKAHAQVNLSLADWQALQDRWTADAAEAAANAGITPGTEL